jgi:hypothetical protein
MADHNELMTPQQPQQVVEFGSFRSPDAALKEAEMVARAFQRRAITLGLYQAIGESKHLKIEGWQMLAAMYRVTASIDSTRFVEYGDARGFEATASAIYVPTGQRISSAEAMCLDDEDKWGAVSKYEWIQPEGGGAKVKTKVGDVRKPLQQLRSMAQTRAQSKCLSNLLKWVAKMAGFAPTPAEEMMSGQESNEAATGSAANESSGPQRSSNGGPLISEPRQKRLWALLKGAGKTREQLDAIMRSFGYEHVTEIANAKYDAVCAAVQDPNWKPGAEASAPIVSSPAQSAKPGPDAGGELNAKEVWAEVVRSFGGEVKALAALNRLGHESWAHVNAAERTRVAMKLIEEAKF